MSARIPVPLQTPELIATTLNPFAEPHPEILEDARWVISKWGWDLAYQCADEVFHAQCDGNVTEDVLSTMFVAYADRRGLLDARMKRAQA